MGDIGWQEVGHFGCRNPSAGGTPLDPGAKKKAMLDRSGHEGTVRCMGKLMVGDGRGEEWGPKLRGGHWVAGGRVFWVQEPIGWRDAVGSQRQEERHACVMRDRSGHERTVRCMGKLMVGDGGGEEWGQR